MEIHSINKSLIRRQLNLTKLMTIERAEENLKTHNIILYINY